MGLRDIQLMGSISYTLSDSKSKWSVQFFR
jgi:hypothetical protein